jgi:hypothetical protein
MPVEDHQYGDRAWFQDARGVVRRMGVSTHPADSTIVISLWQGERCTGTFHMPATDAAGLISTLAYGMAAAPPGERSDPGPGATGLRVRWARLVQRLLGGPPSATRNHLRLLK